MREPARAGDGNAGELSERSPSSKLDDPHRKHFLAATAFAYAALFIAEGTGLWLQNKWAEYLTLIATASFLPFEIYEVVKRVTALRVVVIVINAAIVVYLVWRLRHRKD